MPFIYFDNNATTPVRPEVFEALKPFLASGGEFGNPSSLHTTGQRARAALETARERVAGLLGAADPEEIVFTSSGTESDNMAIIGAAFAHRDKGRRIVTSAVEHHAVLHALDYLEKEHGFAVTRLPVDRHGLVSPASLAAALTPDTILVTLMASNNEIGTIQPLRALGEVCRKAGVLFHTDAVQSAGKARLDLKREPVDMASISGHKIYAPKGIGALYLRRGVRLHPILHGGAHEKNRRAGTENISGAVGLGAACALATAELDREPARVRALRDRLESGILKRVPAVFVNGHPTERLGNTTNLTFECVEGESLVLALDQAGFALKNTDTPGVEVSTGSACASGLLEPSHVLKAIGVPAEHIHGSVRFSLGHFNSDADVDAALEIVPAVVARLRALSPLWEDRLKGAGPR
ncbi:MAG: aminotransferase class V-fold PLP-dependent enzyme [Elusimicrobia bacterium]|jgi:cysteine desulfurase|nr:MAG: aminotransferase class V-fold PLP-dependent enzyme [Elusimicrobiota bacterium]